MSAKSPAAPGFGINMIGYVTGNLGLGVATRNTIRMLKGLGVPVALTDVDPGGKRSRHDTTHEPLPDDATAAERTPYALNIFHMNPPGLADQLWMQPSWTMHDRISACVPFWELPVLPPSWVPVLDAMDIVLTPTRFIDETVRKALPDATCIYYRQAVFLPGDIVADRARWGIPDDSVAFVSSFDISSDMQRKNPDAAIAAFGEAFPGRADVRLVLKLNSTEHMRVLFADRLTGLRATAEADPRIIIIDEVLEYADVLSLYASSDVLVSLHRSEGLGLSLMEAMSLEVPVVATGWSGNMDFMTPENSCVVGYDLVPVESQHPSYSADVVGEGVMWAEPRVAEAAEHMRRLADDPAMRSRMGARAREDMERMRAEYERGPVVEALREATAPGGPVLASHAAKRARILRIARGTAYRNLRRSAGRMLRALGLRRPRA